MTESKKHEDYLLGVNKSEFDRLRFQHSIWSPVTMKLFQRIGVQRGWQCLDVGAGPGFVSFDLRELVGSEGAVTALEPSPFYLQWLKDRAASNHWTNVHCLQGTAETATLPSHSFDLVFVRWVIAFVPDPEQFLIPLFRALKPGGVIAIQDYYYEGLSLFPHGGPCDEMSSIVRAYYRFGGGDPYVTGRIPPILRAHGLTLTDFTPTCMSGGPSSEIMDWAYQFFEIHIPLMAEKGVLSHDQSLALMADWNAHRKNPDALFFSPLVVDIAATTPR